MSELSSVEQEILNAMRQRRPGLEPCVPELLRLHERLVRCYDNGGTLFTCGNGGSNADAMHIVGELCKSFERKRPISPEMRTALHGLPHGEDLAIQRIHGFPSLTDAAAPLAENQL